MILHQGATNLCGCFSAVISTTKALRGLKRISKEYQRQMLEAIYEYLDETRELLQVHKEGTNIWQLKNYFLVLDSKLRADFGITIKFVQPLSKCTNLSQQDVIDYIREQAEQANTAILICIRGKYNHWTTVEKVQSSINLLDSDNIKYIPLKSIPKIHIIYKTYVYLIKASKL